jgi:transketolase
MGSLESVQARFEAFGWGTRICDGLDVVDTTQALKQFPFKAGAPSVLIGRTKAGAGVSFMEDQVLWHYRTPSVEDLERALKELSIA